MTYVRVTRDQRGYENTFLLHSSRPGEPARVIYWYRSAPGVRVGRSALDEDAIRSIEEQHPEIDFDWPQLLDEAAASVPEAEPRTERRRRPARPQAPPDEPTAPVPVRAETLPPVKEEPSAPSELQRPMGEIRSEVPRHSLLEQLVGREIAQRLRTRYEELSDRIRESNKDEPTRAALEQRAAALDPDRWVSVEAVLHGVEHADRMLDELRRDL